MTTTSATSPVQRKTFQNRGFSLSYLDSQPAHGAKGVVLFLHGFPDSALMWEKQIERLTAEGYRCIAPDTLGCGQSDISSKQSDYHALTLVKDHIALLDHLGIEKVDLVGHDWGAAKAWLLAAYYPQRVRKLATMSVGHPTSYARSDLRQKLASWYIVYFCLHGLSNRLLGGKGRFSLERVFGSHPEMGEVRARLSEPDRLVAALNIYRASLPGALLKPHPKVPHDTLGIWSEGDVFCLEKQMRDSAAWVEGRWHYERRACHHWIPLAEPEWVSETLLAHFS